MNQNRLRKKINRFPQTSGVYFMRDVAGRVIYIGKATNLRSRLTSYFQTFLAPKTRSMMQEVVNITYRKTESDLDALLLEARLIKELQPKYNMRLTDDKTFPLLAITKEEFPRVFITRERGKRDNVYYGPFISNTDLRNAFRTLQRIFRFRICKYKISSSKALMHLHPVRNDSIACNKDEQNNKNNLVENISNGASSLYKKENKKQSALRNCLLSHINLCSAPCLDRINQSNYQEMINSLKDFLIGKKVSLRKRLEKLMRESSHKLDYENAAIYRDQINSLRNISRVGKLGLFYEELLISETPLEKLRLIRKILSLSNIPLHIEGIDVSDIKGNQAVGSVVVFIDGEPVKDLYRRFKIKETSEGVADDYSRIKEIVRRRFSRLIQTDTKVDLFLIDGGKGHLKVVFTAFDNMKIKPPPIVGLAKGTGIETIYLLKNGVITKFKMNNKLKLLDYIRDEAHNFAQRYHHLRRSKETINPML
ncbi:MAG: GIY-YIG nuclease family protein [Planctomycetota bacterium]